MCVYFNYHVAVSFLNGGFRIHPVLPTSSQPWPQSIPRVWDLSHKTTITQTDVVLVRAHVHPEIGARQGLSGTATIKEKDTGLGTDTDTEEVTGISTEAGLVAEKGRAIGEPATMNREVGTGRETAGTTKTNDEPAPSTPTTNAPHLDLQRHGDSKKTCIPTVVTGTGHHMGMATEAQTTWTGIFSSSVSSD